MLAQLFSIIAPVFICAGIGYLWARLGKPFNTELVASLITTFGTPALVFSALVTSGLKLESFGVMALVAVASMAVIGVISLPLLKLFGLSRRSYLPSVMIPNSGNMGLPLCYLAFGDEGLALAIVYYSMTSLTQFTVAPAIVSGTSSARQFLKVPLLWAVVAAFAMILSGLSTPQWILNTTRILGGMTIPMLLITLGFSLASLKISGLRDSLVLSLMRLVMGIAAGFAFAEGFGFEGVERGVIILQSAMPVAVFNYLFAERFQRNPSEVAGAVVISTLTIFAILPIILWLVL